MNKEEESRNGPLSQFQCNWSFINSVFYFHWFSAVSVFNLIDLFIPIYCFISTYLHSICSFFSSFFRSKQRLSIWQSFLGVEDTPQHMEFLGQESDLSLNPNLHCSCANARSLTRSAGPGIKPESQGCRDASDPIVPQWELLTFFSFLSFFFFFFFFPVAYGNSRARGRNRGTAAGLHHHHSHSNKGSEPRLQTTPELTATLDP